MVGNHIPPHAVLLNAHHVFRLVFVKLVRAHNPQPRVLARARQVKQHTHARINLPHMVRVQALQSGYRRRLQQLVGVQLVIAQTARNRAYRQRAHFARFPVYAHRVNLFIRYQHFHRPFHGHQPLAVFAHRFHQQGGNHLRIALAQRRFACIGAAFARRFNHHPLKLLIKRCRTHIQLYRLRPNKLGLAAARQGIQLRGNGA